MLMSQRMQNSKIKHNIIVSVICTFGLAIFSFGFGSGFSLISTFTSDDAVASVVDSDFSSIFVFFARLFRISGLDSFRKKSANTKATPETPPATNLRMKCKENKGQRKVVIHLAENAAKSRSNDEGGRTNTIQSG